MPKYIPYERDQFSYIESENIENEQISPYNTKNQFRGHNYNTRLSASFHRRFPEIKDCSVNLTDILGGSRRSSFGSTIFDSQDSDIKYTQDMSFRGGVYANTNTNPNANCAEPEFGSGRLSKILIAILLIGITGLLFVMFKDKLVPTKISEDEKILKVELAGIRSQIGQMKDNMQSIIKTKQETTRLIQDVNKMFLELKKTTTECDAEAKAKELKHECKADEEDMGKVIQSALNTYNADKTGKADYALGSAGAFIITTRDTKEYNVGNVISFFGYKLCTSNLGPKTILQPPVSPGECWAFKGMDGKAVIQLVASIYVSGVTLEHIPKSIAPSGDVSSAPKDFSVWGLSNSDDENGLLLGRFMYSTARASPVQYFAIDKSSMVFEQVEFKFHSNHGHPEYTCIYRVRVHGSQTKPKTIES